MAEDQIRRWGKKVYGQGSARDVDIHVRYNSVSKPSFYWVTGAEEQYMENHSTELREL